MTVLPDRLNGQNTLLVGHPVWTPEPDIVGRCLVRFDGRTVYVRTPALTIL